MTPQKLEEEFLDWQKRGRDVLGFVGEVFSGLDVWLRNRLKDASPSERIQLRTMCALRGKAQVYDDVAEKVRP